LHTIRLEAQLEQRDLIDRLMFVPAYEAARSAEEEALRLVPDGNARSIFGSGFAPFHSCVLQSIDAMDSQVFVNHARSGLVPPAIRAGRQQGAHGTAG
jgi:hypothetical protein